MRVAAFLCCILYLIEKTISRGRERLVPTTAAATGGAASAAVVIWRITPAAGAPAAVARFQPVWQLWICSI